MGVVQNLTILVDTVRVNTVNISLRHYEHQVWRCRHEHITYLVEENKEDRVITETRQSVQKWHLDAEPAEKSC